MKLRGALFTEGPFPCPLGREEMQKKEEGRQKGSADRLVPEFSE